MTAEMLEGDDGQFHQIRSWADVDELRGYMLHPEKGELEFSGKTFGVRVNRRRMYFCICNEDRHFRSDETALDHLREVGALD